MSWRLNILFASKSTIPNHTPPFFNGFWTKYLQIKSTIGVLTSLQDVDKKKTSLQDMPCPISCKW